MENSNNFIDLPERENYPALLVERNKSHFNKDWYQTRGSVFGSQGQPFHRLNLRRFVDFLRVLRERRLDDIFEDITTIRNPHRAEWLDDNYVKRNGELYVLNHRIKQDGTLETSECLMEPKRIDLDYWLEHATAHGLPPKNTPNGSLNYIPPYVATPRITSTTWFWASPERVTLTCGIDPTYTDPVIGVRLAKLKSN